jgi:hypothetical protein
MPILVALQLPSGQTVYQSQPDVPRVGAHVKCRGDYWVVVEVVTDGPDGALAVRLTSAAAELDDLAVEA